jgi:hypothetical protein
MTTNPASPIGFTARDLAAVRCLVSCFETSKPRGNPSAFAVLNDGAGISYGLHQATHKSGTLAAVVEAYCKMPQSRHAGTLVQYLATFKDKRESIITSAARNPAIQKALIEAAADPWMTAAQHHVFDREYMQPALGDCKKRGFTLPLLLAMVYDSRVQGGWHICAGRVATIPDERAWALSYFDVRERWLKAQTNDARKTTYRPQALRNLAAVGNWGLVGPFNVQKGKGFITVTEADIQAGTVGQ